MIYTLQPHTQQRCISNTNSALAYIYKWRKPQNIQTLTTLGVPSSFSLCLAPYTCLPPTAASSKKDPAFLRRLAQSVSFSCSFLSFLFIRRSSAAQGCGQLAGVSFRSRAPRRALDERVPLWTPTAWEIAAQLAVYIYVYTRRCNYARVWEIGGGRVYRRARVP